MDAALHRLARDSRAQIVAGELRGVALDRLLRSVPPLDLDPFVDELLAIDPPPPDVDLPPGAVPYLPCGAGEILAFAADLALGHTDTVIDLGAGLGRVVFLVHLLCGAKAIGIEIQDQLIARAKETRHELRATGVELVHASFVDVELEGSAVFMHAPCNGAMLARVLDRVAALAQRRSIAVGTVGFELDVSWLAAVPSSRPALALYRS